MQTNDFLFPQRLTRRDFLKLAGGTAAGLAVAPGLAFAQEDKQAPVRFGSGHHTYTLDEAWGKLPEGMKYGLGCGIIVDGQDRVYVTSRSTSPCVAVFSREGKLIETWGNDFADKVGYSLPQVKDTAHCLYWSKEGNQEFIYFTENVSTNKQGPKLGKRVYKTDLKGKILYQLGNVAEESSTAQKFDFTSPTDVAVAPNGDIYIVDGYGSQLVHRFDKNFKLIKTMGGKGQEDGKFNTCHGVWISTLNSEPEVYIADRNNKRLQVFSLDLEHKRTLTGDVRNPCCFYQHNGNLYIPDLASRVTIIDAKDKLVAHLGDGEGVPKDEKEKNPAFMRPHALTVDSQGSIYVLEWVPEGRVRKFRHTPQA